MTKLRLLSLGASIFGMNLALAGTANAAPIDTESLIQRTCLGSTRAQPEVARRRLSAFILSDAGELETDSEARILRLLNDDEAGPESVRNQVRAVVTILQQQLAQGSSISPVDLGLQAVPNEASGGWLFERNVRLACTFAPETADGSSGGATQPSPGRVLLDHLRLRQNPDALAATGEARLKAGSAQIGYERERVILADGSTRRDTTLSIEAALGYAFVDEEASSLLIYGAYHRERSRSVPAPQLAQGASPSDGDTNVIELGLTGHQLVSTDPVSFVLTGSGSVIFDRVKRSERLRLNLSTEFAFGAFPGGICYFGSFAPPIDFGFAHLRGRCSLTLMGQVNHVMDAGTATFGVNDEFVLVGGRFGFDLATAADGGVIAGFTYEYQRTLHGSVPSIDRFTAHLKYRHWFRGRRFGMDFGFDYADGINPDSFVDENRLSFGVGFIF